MRLASNTLDDRHGDSVYFLASARYFWRFSKYHAVSGNRRNIIFDVSMLRRFDSSVNGDGVDDDVVFAHIS